MEWLKELGIDDETVNKIKQALPMHFIPKDQYNKKAEGYNTLKSDYDTLKADHDTIATDFEATKAKASEVDKYKADYEAANATIDTLKSDNQKSLEKLQKQYSVERKLRAANVVEDGIDLLMKDIDLDTLELNDGDVALDLDTLKEKRKSFFYTKTIAGEPPKAGDPPTKPAKDMSVEEYAKSAGVKGLI